MTRCFAAHPLGAEVLCLRPRGHDGEHMFGPDVGMATWSDGDKEWRYLTVEVSIRAFNDVTARPSDAPCEFGTRRNGKSALDMSDYKGTGTMAAGSSFSEMEHEKFARLRADLNTARTALERIAEYETDWAKGTADNVGALQAIAEGALHLPSEPAPSAPLPRNPTWNEALLEQAQRDAARAKSGATPLAPLDTACLP